MPNIIVVNVIGELRVRRTEPLQNDPGIGLERPEPAYRDGDPIR